jgi:hypothetical protein
MQVHAGLQRLLLKRLRRLLREHLVLRTISKTSHVHNQSLCMMYVPLQLGTKFVSSFRLGDLQKAPIQMIAYSNQKLTYLYGPMHDSAPDLLEITAHAFDKEQMSIYQARVPAAL